MLDSVGLSRGQSRSTFNQARLRLLIVYSVLLEIPIMDPLCMRLGYEQTWSSSRETFGGPSFGTFNQT